MSKVFFESFPGSCKNIKTESLEIRNKATVHIAAKLVSLDKKTTKKCNFQGELVLLPEQMPRQLFLSLKAKSRTKGFEVPPDVFGIVSQLPLFELLERSKWRKQVVWRRKEEEEECY